MPCLCVFFFFYLFLILSHVHCGTVVLFVHVHVYRLLKMVVEQGSPQKNVMVYLYIIIIYILVIGLCKLCAYCVLYSESSLGAADLLPRPIAQV